VKCGYPGALTSARSEWGWVEPPAEAGGGGVAGYGLEVGFVVGFQDLGVSRFPAPLGAVEKTKETKAKGKGFRGECGWAFRSLMGTTEVRNGELNFIN
jgi:hypothetical protein